MIFLVLYFIAFPKSDDSLLSSAPPNSLKIESSGQMGLRYNGKCNPTYPNYTITESEKHDFCSNIAKNNDRPWVSYSFPGKELKLTGYSLRNGCCYYYCCCSEETGEIIDYSCCCELYAFSLEGSNDNKTWTKLHQIKDDQDYISWCQVKTYQLSTTNSYKYVRFVLDDQRHGWPRCKSTKLNCTEN